MIIHKRERGLSNVALWKEMKDFGSRFRASFLPEVLRCILDAIRNDFMNGLVSVAAMTCMFSVATMEA